MHVGVPAQNRPIIGDTGLADGSETTGECGETSLLSIKNLKGAGLNIKSCTRYQLLMSPDINRCFISMPRQKNQSLKCSYWFHWFASVRKWRLRAPVCMCCMFTAAHSCSVILSRKLFFSHFCDRFTGEGVTPSALKELAQPVFFASLQMGKVQHMTSSCSDPKQL